uniref:Ig-like domain-containing protein n=1 Tax=Sinocyclocheilus anshuiensis TaxID=1608454 RepID=A0A671RVY4_9TELE
MIISCEKLPLALYYCFNLIVLNNLTLLVPCFSAVSGQSLTSSHSVVKKPGESVTLSCTVSGFSMSRKALEWIGRIDGGTGTIFAQSLQDQFSITKDTSKNMLYLQVKSLKTEDIRQKTRAAQIIFLLVVGVTVFVLFSTVKFLLPGHSIQL